ncbi:hypothetical protein [Vibrio cincinnatiensis]|uniref:hypothetical protein n=1 Tax=Vibrio cincinnatiensis TaxID=675 RepID=UPI001EDF28DB|nr:hypothetical protein [Vibrio cincinnatiensis]MCG3724131.1 hypothetical protein [Vibrio cincinnatiensis]
MKREIAASPAERFLKNEVCSHLKPIEDFLLAEKKISFTEGEPLVNDRSDGFIRYVQGALELKSIEDEFDIPDFVVLQDDYGVFCKKCWCSIKTS